MSFRIAGLAILTTCMFAFSIYMQNGVWLFPFGLFKIGLCLVAIILLINQRSRLKLLDYLILAWSGFLAFSSHFMFTFFVREQSFETKGEFLSGISSLLFFAFSIGLVSWQILIALQSKNWRKWIQLISAFALFICLLSNGYEWIIFPSVLWFISVYGSSEISDLNQAMGSLLTFVIVSSWISGCYFGMERVLSNL